MEAPKTIFVNNLGYGCLSEPCTDRMFASQIEYVRKDVFIKEVCEWLRKGGSGWYLTSEFGEDTIDFVKLAEDFKKTI